MDFVSISHEQEWDRNKSDSKVSEIRQQISYAVNYMKVDLAKVADLAEAESESCWVLWRLVGASHLLFDHHHSAHHLRLGHHLTTYTPSWKKKHTDHHDRWMLSWWCDRECPHIQLHYSLFLCTLNTLPPPFLWKKNSLHIRSPESGSTWLFLCGMKGG